MCLALFFTITKENTAGVYFDQVDQDRGSIEEITMPYIPVRMTMMSQSDNPKSEVLYFSGVMGWPWPAAKHPHRCSLTPLPQQYRGCSGWCLGQWNGLQGSGLPSLQPDSSHFHCAVCSTCLGRVVAVISLPGLTTLVSQQLLSVLGRLYSSSLLDHSLRFAFLYYLYDDFSGHIHPSIVSPFVCCISPQMS